MNERFMIFEYRFNDPELEEDFNDFFHRYNLNPLFTNEHRAGTITVTWADARSVTNEGGSYAKTLKEFADLINSANDNKSYSEAMFKILYESRTFQGLMSNIRKVMQYIRSIPDDRLHNKWNIVWYDKTVL